MLLRERQRFHNCSCLVLGLRVDQEDDALAIAARIPLADFSIEIELHSGPNLRWHDCHDLLRVYARPGGLNDQHFGGFRYRYAGHASGRPGLWFHYGFCGAERFSIRSEELFQRLWIPAGYDTNRIRRPEAFRSFPEILPKMRQMIERVRIDSLLHCPNPLLVRNRYVADLPPYRFTKGFDNFPHRRRFTHEGVHALGRQTGIRQEGCRNAGNIFRTGEGNDRRLVAPRQEGGILLGYAATDESAYIFVIRRRLKMNGANLRPLEHAIGQAMLQVSEGGSVL